MKSLIRTLRPKPKVHLSPVSYETEEYRRQADYLSSARQEARAWLQSHGFEPPQILKKVKDDV